MASSQSLSISSRVMSSSFLPDFAAVFSISVSYTHLDVYKRQFQHRAGVSSYTSSFDLAQTCVFGKQLLGPILCGSISGAPLLPKLRGQFAEFLNNPSPVGLRIFFLPTCVGLRYGHRRNTHSFSRHLPSRTSVLISLDRYRNQHPAPRLQMCPCA